MKRNSRCCTGLQHRKLTRELRESNSKEDMVVTLTLLGARQEVGVLGPRAELKIVERQPRLTMKGPQLHTLTPREVAESC